MNHFWLIYGVMFVLTASTVQIKLENQFARDFGPLYDPSYDNTDAAVVAGILGALWFITVPVWLACVLWRLIAFVASWRRGE
ncbi:MAG: hypothetical protein JWN38_1267 [Candidatus Saccharibacteria bacterium]|nr:hypothetical protein [Candidatus Saccharibacteria bacterium]